MVQRLRGLSDTYHGLHNHDEALFLSEVADKIEASPEATPLDPAHHHVTLLIGTLREVALKLAEQHKCTCRREV